MISGTSARRSAELARQAGLSNEIAKLQDQVSTGKKLTSPSQDPVGFARVAAIRQTQADDATYSANINTAQATATRADAAMTSLSNALDQAREIVTAASNGTANSDARAAYATQLRSLAQDVRSIAEQKDSRGNAVFPTEKPLAVPIAPGLQVAATVARNTLFGTTDASGQPSDMAAMLEAAADAVTTADASTRSGATAAALDRIVAATEQVANVHADQGLRAARMDARADAIANDGVALSTERSNIEDTDIASAISLITSKMTTLSAAQAVFAKVSKQTLFDVL